jgi:hypothetical protein
MAVGWLANAVFYFGLASQGLTWGYTIVNFVQAALFWRMSTRRLFPRPLFVLSVVAVGLNFLATLTSVNFWWSAFVLNRLFDLMLLYIAGCALFRIFRLRQKKKGALMARPSQFIVAAQPG